MLFKKNKPENKKVDDEVKLVLLKSTNDSYELSMIESILKDNSIPYILHDNGIGEYMRIYMGTSLFGTDIMVAEKDFENAHELIEGVL